MSHMALFFINKTVDERASSREIRRRRIDDVGSSVSYHLLLDGKGIGLAVVCDSAYTLPPSQVLGYSSPCVSDAAVDVIRFTDYLLALLDSLAMKAEQTASLGAAVSGTASVEPPSQRLFTGGRGPLARMLARSANQHKMLPADSLFSSADAYIKPNAFSSQSAAFNTRVAEVLAETSDRPAVPLYSSKACQRQCRRTSGSSWTFFAAK